MIVDSLVMMQTDYVTVPHLDKDGKVLFMLGGIEAHTGVTGKETHSATVLRPQ